MRYAWKGGLVGRVGRIGRGNERWRGPYDGRRCTAPPARGRTVRYGMALARRVEGYGRARLFAGRAAYPVKTLGEAAFVGEIGGETLQLAIKQSGSLDY